MVIQTWFDMFINSLLKMLDEIIFFVPNLLGAILLFIIGVVIAKALQFSTEKIISFIKLDSLLKRIKLDVYLQRAELRLNSGKFLGAAVYWIILTIFFISIFDILGLFALSGFINTALEWILTNLIVAVLILLVTAFIAQFLRKIVNASVLGAKLYSIKFLSSATWWVVMIFGFITSLNHLGLNTELIESALMSFVIAAPAAIAIAFGLAFGLGGKKQAEQILERLEDKWEER